MLYYNHQEEHSKVQFRELNTGFGISEKVEKTLDKLLKNDIMIISKERNDVLDKAEDSSAMLGGCKAQ